MTRVGSQRHRKKCVYINTSFSTYGFIVHTSVLTSLLLYGTTISSIVCIFLHLFYTDTLKFTYKKGIGKGHPCTGTEALYRPYDP